MVETGRKMLGTTDPVCVCACSMHICVCVCVCVCVGGWVGVCVGVGVCVWVCVGVKERECSECTSAYQSVLPAVQKDSAPGTIRGDFSIHIGR